MKKLSSFKNEDEERKFWATADSTKYIGWSQGKRKKLIELKPSLRTISLRLPVAMIEDLKLLANQRDVPYQSLLKVFLAERLAKERPLRRAQKSARVRYDVPSTYMRDFDENNITAAVIDRYKNTPDPRLKKIMTSLVQHLHDFVRDVEPTEAEWGQAVDFLTRTGKLCTDKRQEFILLSDTLGVSMLVDAINHRFSKDATESTVMGPFYVQNPPEAAFGADIRGEAKGAPLYIDGSILSENGEPVANAIVDVWHSDAEGFYDVQLPELEEPTLRARFHSDAQGRFRFWTIMPKFYPIPDDGTVGEMLKASARHPYRPAHVHFMIIADGHETLVTHVFVDGDQYLDSDAVFAVKNSLIRDFTQEAPGVAPDGKKIDTPWRKLHTDFVLSKAAVRKSAPAA